MVFGVFDVVTDVFIENVLTLDLNVVDLWLQDLLAAHPVSCLT